MKENKNICISIVSLILSIIFSIFTLYNSDITLKNSNLPLMSYNGDYFVDIGYYYPDNNGFLISKTKEIYEEKYNYRIEMDSEKIANLKYMYGNENIAFYAPDLHFIKFYLTLENKGNGVANDIRFYSLNNNTAKFKPIKLYYYEGIPSSSNSINISCNERMNLCFKICMDLAEDDDLKGILCYSDINGNVYQDEINFSVNIENNHISPEIKYKKIYNSFFKKILCFFGFFDKVTEEYKGYKK